jgi:hypothetical protein
MGTDGDFAVAFRHCGLDPQSPDREPFVKRGVGWEPTGILCCCERLKIKICQFGFLKLWQNWI